jgi:DNA-directed RNA polymerase specialized sigma24 family protein
MEGHSTRSDRRHLPATSRLPSFPALNPEPGRAAAGRLAGVAPVEYAAFVALRPELLRVARALLKGSRIRLEPEDMVQTVLTRILAGLRDGRIQPDTIQSPAHFAFASLRHFFLDELKAARTRLESTTADAAAERAAAPAGGQPSLLLRQILGRFSVEERCFLVRILVEERSVPESQRMCGWPPVTPYYQLERLLDRARGIVS